MRFDKKHAKKDPIVSMNAAALYTLSHTAPVLPPFNRKKKKRYRINRYESETFFYVQVDSNNYPPCIKCNTHHAASNFLARRWIQRTRPEYMPTYRLLIS
jgi:hypothetical protein